MFFQTQLKTIGAGGAVDMQGRRLAFIGYLPCKAGDWVFTDGNIIFGNSPPKGSPTPATEQPSGIPVLSDDLRGYFTSRGKFKSYKIAGSDWIVNDEKIFAHDSDASNIIDAEIADDGGVYTVEKIIEEIGGTPIGGNNGVLFYRYYSDEPQFYVLGHQQRYLSMINFDTNSLAPNTRKENSVYWVGDFIPEYVKSDSVIKQPVIIIRKDGKEIQTITMQDLVARVEDFALQCAYVPLELPEQHINAHAQLLNFKILPDGSWIALIIAEVGAERDVREDDKPSGKLKMATVAAHLVALDKISSDGNCERITQYLKHFPFYRVTDVKTQLQGPIPFVADRTTFPYNDGDNTAVEFGSDGGAILSHATGVVWNSRYMPNAPDYDAVYFNALEEFSFPVQDKYSAKFIPTESQSESQSVLSIALKGVFDKDDNRITGTAFLNEPDAHKWNMSIAPLKNGGYLFGIHKDTAREVGGFLYKVDRDGNIEQVGAGLKNFRLRELKKIGKSKT